MRLEPGTRIWMDGEFVPAEEATVHVLSHGLHYGSGVFEGIRAYETPNGAAVFRLTDHMRRLQRSAAVYRMDLPYTLDELVGAAKETVRLNALTACYIRPIAFRGPGGMGLNPLESPVSVSIAAWPWATYLGEEGLERGIRVTVSSWRRPGPSVLPAGAKASGHYLNCQLAVLEAVASGYDDAVMLAEDGSVAEGTGENVFAVNDGRLLTPPVTAGILAGITRDSVMSIARDLEFEVLERPLALEDLYTADEVFLTGTAAEVCPVREIDGRRIGSGGRGPLTHRIQETFFAAAGGLLPGYAGWNELVESREVAPRV